MPPVDNKLAEKIEDLCISLEELKQVILISALLQTHNLNDRMNHRGMVTFNPLMLQSEACELLRAIRSRGEDELH